MTTTVPLHHYNVSYSNSTSFEYAWDLEDLDIGFVNTRTVEENLSDFRAAKFLFEFPSAIENITANLFSHPRGGLHKVNNRNDSVFEGMVREKRLYNNFNSQNKPLGIVDFIRMRYDYDRMIYSNLRE